MKLFVSVLGAAGLAACSFGQVVDMDHISGAPGGLISTRPLGVTQYAPGTSVSSMVIEDFNPTGTHGLTIGVAFEVTNPNFDLAWILGWRISFWDSPNAAANSGSELSGNSIGRIIPANGMSYTELFGTQATGRTIYGIGSEYCEIPWGIAYMGMAPILSPAASGQVYILARVDPQVLGNGTANNAARVNPLNGLGQGNLLPIGANAAYRIETVPEPATVLAVAGALLFMRKRRASR